MLCLIKVNSNLIECTVHPSCYWVKRINKFQVFPVKNHTLISWNVLYILVYLLHNLLQANMSPRKYYSSCNNGKFGYDFFAHFSAFNW